MAEFIRSSDRGSVPLVSVVLSVHNGMPYLVDAVESVLKQTFEDFEFLILDDASSDGTRDYLQSISDPRVRVILLESNIGLTAALNQGLKEARGQFVARQDADDVSHSSRFRLQLAHLNATPNCAAVGSQVVLMDAKGRSLGKKRFPLSSDSMRFFHLFDCALAHSAVMFRRAAVEQVGGYDESFAASQDYDLWSRLSERHTLANLPESLLSLRILETSITRQHRRPELIQKVQREHFARVFALQATDSELALIGWFRSRVPLEELPRFSLLLDELLARYVSVQKNVSGDFYRMLSLIHERVGYNLLEVSKVAGWRQLFAAVRAWPGCLLSLPWPRIIGLTLFGNRARQIYSKLTQ